MASILLYLSKSINLLGSPWPPFYCLPGFPCLIFSFFPPGADDCSKGTLALSVHLHLLPSCGSQFCWEPGTGAAAACITRPVCNTGGTEAVFHGGQGVSRSYQTVQVKRTQMNTREVALNWMIGITKSTYCDRLVTMPYYISIFPFCLYSWLAQRPSQRSLCGFASNVHPGSPQDSVETHVNVTSVWVFCGSALPFQTWLELTSNLRQQNVAH